VLMPTWFMSRPQTPPRVGNYFSVCVFESVCLYFCVCFKNNSISLSIICVFFIFHFDPTPSVGKTIHIAGIGCLFCDGRLSTFFSPKNSSLFPQSVLRRFFSPTDTFESSYPPQSV